MILTFELEIHMVLSYIINNMCTKSDSYIRVYTRKCDAHVQAWTHAATHEWHCHYTFPCNSVVTVLLIH